MNNMKEKLVKVLAFVAFFIIAIAANSKEIEYRKYNVFVQDMVKEVKQVPFPITGTVKVFDRNNQEIGSISYTATVKLSESEQIFSTVKVLLKNKCDKDVEGCVYAVVNGKRASCEKFEIVPNGEQKFTIYEVKGEVKQILVEPLHTK